MPVIETFRTEPPKNYFSPLERDIDRAASRTKLGNYSKPLLLDMAHVSAGGTTVRREALREHATAEILAAGHPREADPKVFRKLVDRQIKYHENICRFLSNLDLERQPGNSPLMQAANVLKVLSKAQTPGKGGEDGESENLPIFREQDGKELAEKFNDAADAVQGMAPEERELFQDGEPEEGSDGDEDEGQMMDVIQAFIQNDLLAMVELARSLNQISNFQARKVIKRVLDREGADVRQRALRGFDELNRMNKSEWAYPSGYRNYRVLKGIANLRERVKPVTYRQLIYMIVDRSGSMRCETRVEQATSILINRLMAVAREDAEVFFSWFTTTLSEQKHVSDSKEAKSMVRKILTDTYGGGGTAITRCVDIAISRINEMDEVHRPEVVVVSDGEDTVYPFSKSGGVRVHAFIVGSCSNAGLMAAARASGGVAYRVDELTQRQNRKL